MLSSAAARPRSGLLPAPNPSVRLSPSRIRIGTGLRSSACRSVLQTMNETSVIPNLYMWFTALLPPPPTPTTMMMDELTGAISTNSTIVCMLYASLLSF